MGAQDFRIEIFAFKLIWKVWVKFAQQISVNFGLVFNLLKCFRKRRKAQTVWSNKDGPSSTCSGSISEKVQQAFFWTRDAPIQSKRRLFHINTPGDPFRSTLQPSTHDPVVIDGTTRPGATNHFALYEMDVQVTWDYRRTSQLLATPIVGRILVPGRRSIYYQCHLSPQGQFQSTLNHLVLLEAFVPHESTEPVCRQFKNSFSAHY